MTIDPLRLGLKIDSPLITPNAPNYRPSTWPPAPDWPIIFDAAGDVVSRWGDALWRLFPWVGKPKVLNFGDGHMARSAAIDARNADLLRRTVGWWVWGPNGVRSANTLLARFGLIRPVFVLCSREGVLASELVSAPWITDRISTLMTATRADELLRILHAIYEQRNDIGFTLLDREGLLRLSAACSGVAHHKSQTPYIPPRIWHYQVSRLRACLDDFIAHRERIEDCFRFCMEAYAYSYGSLAAAFIEPGSSASNPFQWPRGVPTGGRRSKRYHGPFSLTAKRFGVEALLARWVGPRGRKDGFASIGVDSLSGYLTLVSRAGLAYVLNFSLMRIEEGWSLRADCLHVLDDPTVGLIHTLHGVTTKTMRDNEAIWVTSPATQVAVDAMRSIAKLRMACAAANPAVAATPEDLSNPYLQTFVYEPWNVGRTPNYHVRREHPTYRTLMSTYPRLFDTDQMRITKEDINLARLVTPKLDAQKFSVGEVWPLAWHQLRRTGRQYAGLWTRIRCFPAIPAQTRFACYEPVLWPRLCAGPA
jgi:hypothetical protein